MFTLSTSATSMIFMILIFKNLDEVKNTIFTRV